jgi:hypothetical protein
MWAALWRACQVCQSRLFNDVNLFRTSTRRARSRRISWRVFGGIAVPSGVNNESRRFGAFRSSGLKPRIPRRARAPF